MLDVAAYAAKKRIPYQYWLADSWWYYKGPTNGVKNWTAMTSVFPHGLEYVYKQTKWLVQGHNRYWDSDTDYAKQNGGQYDFLIDPDSNYALPVDQSFWDFLMQSSREWGLTVYEQDWLDDEFDNFQPLTNSATLGGQWLAQMGAAAAKNGIAIQYCMSHCRHMLASVDVPAVTQARASGDYSQSRTDQWSQLGTTALFAFALGVAPSKDNYWSTSVQPGNKWGKSVELHPRLQGAVLTLTKGPVCPSDKIGLSDRALIMRSAMDDGTLLQPARPATKVDRLFVAAALSLDGDTTEEVWFADTSVSGRRYGVVLAARLRHPYTMDLADDFGFDAAAVAAGMVAVEANTTSTLAANLAANGKLSLQPNGEWDFGLYNLAPREANGWALLGEVSGKWVGVSAARVQRVESTTDRPLDVYVHGTPGEKVTLTFAPPQGTATVDQTCTIGQASSARFSVTGAGKTCCDC